MRKIAVIDCDTLCYLSGLRENESNAETDIENRIEYILNFTEATHKIGFIGKGKCFRYDIAKQYPYKGHRKYEKPPYTEHLLNYLSEKSWIHYHSMFEADDLCLLFQNELLKEKDTEVIICSPDKDLRQVEGHFYDYAFYKTKEGKEGKPEQIEFIDSTQAEYNLWKQVLMGDNSDNIKMLEKVGEKKAEKYLEEWLHLDEPYQSYVLSVFCEHYRNDYIGTCNFTENYRLVKIINTREEYEYITKTKFKLPKIEECRQ